MKKGSAKAMFKKLTSRKFLIAALSALLSFLSALCEAGGDIGAVCSIILTFFAPAVYIITEGVIDARALEGSKPEENAGPTDGENGEKIESVESVESGETAEG